MNKLTIFAIFLIFAFASSKLSENDMFEKFQAFREKYQKEYPTIKEFLYRYKIFKTNVERIETENLKWQGITKFTDMTPEEFRKTYANLKIDVSRIKKMTNIKKVSPKKLNPAPDAFDWRDKGAVNPIKDQRSCGSCWAFCTVANLEGQYFLKYNESMTFSEQMFVDCDKRDEGCNGGMMDNALEWLKEFGGLEGDDTYPYKGYTGSCHANEEDYKIKVTNYKILEEGHTEDDLKEWLYETGPLAIVINSARMQNYYGGIIVADDLRCFTDYYDHGVTLIGYGEEDGVPFWTVKNSWGDGWGENGYFRVYRGNNTCAINTFAISAEVEKYSP